MCSLASEIGSVVSEQWRDALFVREALIIKYFSEHSHAILELSGKKTHPAILLSYPELHCNQYSVEGRASKKNLKHGDILICIY